MAQTLGFGGRRRASPVASATPPTLAAYAGPEQILGAGGGTRRVSTTIEDVKNAVSETGGAVVAHSAQ
jgi:hypothetical protein